jgi:hypothetical protein
MSEEIRAMVLLTLPYPPLPVLITRIETDDERLYEDERSLTTTHTLIAKGLTECMARNDQSDNEERSLRQKRVFQEFLHTMAQEGFATTDPEKLYLIYCRYSLQHIATYFPPGHPVDFRIPPLSHITRRDKVHTKLAEYMAAQSVFFEDQPRIPRDDFLNLEPSELLFQLRARLGHVMTEEERIRAGALEASLQVEKN